MVPPTLGAAFGAVLLGWQLALLRLRPCSPWVSWRLAGLGAVILLAFGASLTLTYTRNVALSCVLLGGSVIAAGWMGVLWLRTRHGTA